MVLIFVVFYFLLIRPQEKKRRQQAQLVSEVKKGEEILTNTVLFGKVVEINDSDNTIMVQVAKDVEIKMLKNSIANIISRNKGEDSKNPKKDTTKKDKALTTKTKKK
jgi:preprotein translocase subunit YajC